MAHKKSPWGKAFDQAYTAWKNAAKRRDEHECKICGSISPLQVDHAIISRGHHATFFDLRNSVTLCSACHTRKTFDKHGMGYRVHKLVEEREGSEAVEALIDLSYKLRKWTITELEELKTQLDGAFT